MDIALILIGIMLCASASFAGAFFGVRSLSDGPKPLRIPIYSNIKEAVEKKRVEGIATNNERLLNEYFYGKGKPEKRGGIL